MNASDDLPAQLTTAYVVDNHGLLFDGGDPLNGSLYLCVPQRDARTHPFVDQLRGEGLWSAQPAKYVAEDQRGAYRDGLVYVDSALFAQPQDYLLLGRFDHPKFPSNADRWRAWLTCAARHYERRR